VAGNLIPMIKKWLEDRKRSAEIKKKLAEDGLVLRQNQQRLDKKVENLISISLADGAISHDEWKEVLVAAQQAGWSGAQIRKESLRILADLTNRRINDGMLDSEDANAIDEFCALAGLSINDLPSSTVNALVLAKQVNLVFTGQTVMAPGSCPILLKPNESAILCVPCYTTKTIRTKYRYSGSSAGVSFRVAKGVTIRTGSSRGQVYSEEQEVIASRGTLVFTNDRIVYAGSGSGKEVKWRDVLTLNPFTNACEIITSKKTTTQMYFYENVSMGVLVDALVQGIRQRQI
jgi:hypothetical protein